MLVCLRHASLKEHVYNLTCILKVKVLYFVGCFYWRANEN